MNTVGQINRIKAELKAAHRFNGNLAHRLFLVDRQLAEMTRRRETLWGTVMEWWRRRKGKENAAH